MAREVARGPLQEMTLQIEHGNLHVTSWQPVSNIWSTSGEPDYVRALGSRLTAQNPMGKICMPELRNCWSTLGQLNFPANSPSPLKLQGLPCRAPLALLKEDVFTGCLLREEFLPYILQVLISLSSSLNCPRNPNLCWQVATSTSTIQTKPRA